MSRENQRLEDLRQGKAQWKRWGPYLSERQWGIVREDYSANGTAWEYFPHDHARSRAYRWGEDGIGGICDGRQRICFAPAFWNRRDPILKERLFGLTGHEGNHGEDVKECYFYLDATPTHSYLKMLYKYPQAEFPYARLVAENGRRTKADPEFELLDTGVFDRNRYFDIFVEYAKATAGDILIRITAWNRGGEFAPLDVLPTIWFRNTWSWRDATQRPRLCSLHDQRSCEAIALRPNDEGQLWLVAEGKPGLLFTDNETNFERLFGVENHATYLKDAFHDYLINENESAVNPAETGTKAAALYRFEIAPGDSATVRLRLSNQNPAAPVTQSLFGQAFDEIFRVRIAEADEFYAQYASGKMTDDARQVQRQAFAGLLWSQQSYHYDVDVWLQGDPAFPPPPQGRKKGRNRGWKHFHGADVLSMPDKWEYPWFASWDTAFHCVALAVIDPEFAKEQLILLLREWYMHPNGQLPAYEWAFDDVNPPVHAWAAWRVYKIEKRVRGRADRGFLERVFQKLLINFTWWVNRKDPDGLNVFEGGFLGLDNVGVFDRSAPLPAGGHLEQADGTSWMGAYCLNMLAIALELSREDRAYGSVASKFFEHFIYITQAMNDLGGEGITLWDEEDGFYYDVLHLPDGSQSFLKVRSMVGLAPLFAVETLEPEMLVNLPHFRERVQWFLENVPAASHHIDMSQRSPNGPRRLLSLVNRERLLRILSYMLNEKEFLSPYGIRSLSRFHQDHPYTLGMMGAEYQVGYEPAESRTGTFGGNSNWRGPIWFPMNFLIIESLQRFHYYYGDQLLIDFPTGSGRKLTLWQIAAELSMSLSSIFLRDKNGLRAVCGSIEKLQCDPYWRNLVLFS
jgi:Mannosylglycerate hydrolase MGH1-like glycoside hydrolase domain/Glycosyl hydrolase family 63 C-terminal domain